MKLPVTFAELFIQAEKEALYEKLVLQLNKDLKYANVEMDFERVIAPEKLKHELHGLIYQLINERFAHYLNLLYIIDVPESSIKKLDGSDMVKLSEQVAFLVLKREWQKVWYRNKV